MPGRQNSTLTSIRCCLVASASHALKANDFIYQYKALFILVKDDWIRASRLLKSWLNRLSCVQFSNPAQHSYESRFPTLFSLLSFFRFCFKNATRTTTLLFPSLYFLFTCSTLKTMLNPTKQRPVRIGCYSAFCKTSPHLEQGLCSWWLTSWFDSVFDRGWLHCCCCSTCQAWRCQSRLSCRRLSCW